MAYSFAAPLTMAPTFSRPHIKLSKRRPPLPVRLSRSTACLSPSASPTFSSFFPDASIATVLTPSGEATSLPAYVEACNAKGEAVLLGWLRHYGCTLCVKQATDWLAILPQLRACGPISVALIGNGPPKHAVQFMEDIGWTGDLFTDPERNTYGVFQFRAGVGSTFNARALGRVVKSFAEGHTQGWAKIPTDAFQQGGVVLVDAVGSVRLLHVDAFAGDHILIDRLVSAVGEVIRGDTGGQE